MSSYRRDEFFDTLWDYRPGEHVTLLGPTGCGKTRLGFEALDRSVTRELPGIVLVMKPRDATVTSWTKKLGFKLIRSWPPKPVFFGERPRGWTLWPKHTMTDFDADDNRMRAEFRRAILGSYKGGNRVLFVDEAQGLAEELDLDKELIRVWSRGRSMGVGLFAASQRPAYIPQLAYGGASHLFLHHDPDDRARKRYDEIGSSVDAGLVREVTRLLPSHHFLYVHTNGKNGPELAIVEP